MRNEIRRVIEGALSDESAQWQSYLADCALLIERHSLNKYTDDTYKQLFSDGTLIEVSLSEEEYKELVRLVVELMVSSRAKAAMAAWALGKTYAVEYSHILVEGLTRYLASRDDEAVYQILIALENCGIDEATPLLVVASNCGDMPKSGPYARDMLERNQ